MTGGPLCELNFNNTNTPITTVDGPLRPIHVVIQEITSGDQKARLSSWWLDLIETKVDLYLADVTMTNTSGRNIHYDAHAVPYNYIDQPPKSMDSIRDNVYIVQKLLFYSTTPITTNSSPQHVEFERFIEDLVQDVYKEIRHFVHVSHDVLETSLPQYTSQDISKLIDKSNNSRDQLNEQQKTKYTALLDDLSYIKDMEKLEGDRKKTDKTREGLSHIVPISGLILSKLHRIDNELVTVMKHWSRSKR